MLKNYEYPFKDRRCWNCRAKEKGYNSIQEMMDDLVIKQHLGIPDLCKVFDIHRTSLTRVLKAYGMYKIVS